MLQNLLPQCSDPAIILNPHLRDLILTYQNYHVNGKEYKIHKFSKWYTDFPYHVFKKIRKHVTMTHDDNPRKKPFNEIDLSQCYIIGKDGIHEPLFMPVPCGKCVLCTEKKANEWVSRAMCESQTSMSPPYFFTLTYNSKCLPKNGVRKGACQRFMKRFRINVERYCGFKCNIRYFICAEYGTLSGRPHYHGILWNLPLLEHSHVVDLVQKSWSRQVSKDFYDSLSSDVDKYGHPIYKFVDPLDGRHRMLYGYTKTSLCNDGRVRYCMKYMRKECNIPQGKKPIFFLSSRRGGLGSAWIEKHMQEYRNNPALMDVQFTDIWSSEMYRGCLPSFFKSKIAPTTSRLISKEIRDLYQTWNLISNKFHTLIGYHYPPSSRVLEHYPTLSFHHAKVYDNIYCTELNNPDEYDSYCRMLNDALLEIEKTLLEYDYDINLARSAPIYKEKHLLYVERFIKSQPKQSIEDKVAKIMRRRERSKKVTFNPYL